MEPVQTQAEVLSIIAERKRHLRSRYHILRIALIGSFARGEQTSESDVDLIVRFEDGTPGLYELKTELKAELQAAFGRPVDLASEKYLKPYYRDHILGDAIYV